MSFIQQQYVVVGFVFLASVVIISLSLLIFLPGITVDNTAKKIIKKMEELLRWSGENPNRFTTDPEPAKLFSSLDKLRRKLKGDWPRSVEKPLFVAIYLRRLEEYPNSQWVIRGLALEKILEGKAIPECARDQVILRVGVSHDLAVSPQ